MGLYCIETNSGKLELMKGAYLTLKKRKTTLEKTIKKTKTICHERKSTIKKQKVIG